MADLENFSLSRMKKSGMFFTSSLSEIEISEDILKKVPEAMVIQYHLLPIKEEDGILTVVTDNQQALKQKAQIQKWLDLPVDIVFAEGENLRLGIQKFYGISNYVRAGALQRKQSEEDVTPLKGLINSMLQAAAAEKASDIHILPHSQGVDVRFRINGHMYDETSRFNFPPEQATNVVNLIKQMDQSGNADLSKTNMPNEGSFYLLHGTTEIFVRLETLPVGNGGDLQKVNLRLLPQAAAGTKSKTLEDIGYTESDLKAIRKALYQSSTGMFINSGPTGSGKTTSLYAQIDYVLKTAGEQLVVITIDDPIEIRQELFTQVQVHKASKEELSLTDEKILTASLRSDPDIILYNEIRNATGATVAMQASATGHKVFSTVHASDCIRTISRLLDLDVSKTTLLSELRLIISQRLIANLCPYCSRPHTLTKEEISVLSKQEVSYLQEGTGLREIGDSETVRNCPHCHHGIVGRRAVAEYVVFNTDIRDALLNQHSFREIRDVLRKFNYRTMWEKGIELVRDGEIELSELIHVVGKED